MLPSGRCRNQAGCSFTQGWSGEAWKARSMATSMPRAEAAATRERKSARVPSCRVDARCGLRRAPDGPGAPRVVRSGRRRPVAALAGGHPDGMDRRQVEDVEAHLLDVVEPRSHVGERAVACRIGRRRAGKQLVPGAEPGFGHLGVEGIGLRAGPGTGIDEIRHHGVELFGEHDARQRLGGRLCRRPRRQGRGDGALEPPRARPEGVDE